MQIYGYGNRLDVPVRFPVDKLTQMGVGKRSLLDGLRYGLMPKGETAYIADGDERRETAIGAWKKRWNHKGFFVRGLEYVQPSNSIHVLCNSRWSTNVVFQIGLNG